MQKLLVSCALALAALLSVAGAGAEEFHNGGFAFSVEPVPGFYFVGLHFLHAMSSSMIQGVGRDARRIAAHIAARGEARPPRPNADAPRRLAHATPA